MKNLVLLFSMIALLSSASCKSKEKAKKDDTTTTSTTKTKSVQNEKKYRFVVSFFSIGTGLDTDAYAKLEIFAKNHPKKPAYDKFSWGREGETDLAFDLKEMKSAEQSKFIEELKVAIGKSDRVRYKENEIASGRSLKAE